MDKKTKGSKLSSNIIEEKNSIMRRVDHEFRLVAGQTGNGLRVSIKPISINTDAR